MSPPMEDILEGYGITIDGLLEAYLGLFIPHPGVETPGDAKDLFRSHLDSAFADVNVCSLILAGFRLEEEAKKGGIPNLEPEDFKNDAVHILADEVLGMAIAEYIGGTRARFEYVRYDMKKPGVLAELGPFVDDVICGLIAGISSRVYTEAGGG